MLEIEFRVKWPKVQDMCQNLVVVSAYERTSKEAHSQIFEYIQVTLNSEKNFADNMKVNFWGWGGCLFYPGRPQLNHKYLKGRTYPTNEEQEIWIHAKASLTHTGLDIERAARSQEM